MDYSQWKGLSFANVLEYNMLAIEMTEDAVVQLSAKGNRIHKSIPQNYVFGMIATSADGQKFVQICTDDLRDGDSWFDNVKIYEMTPDRVLVEKEPHICSWDKLGEEVAKYLA